MKNTGHSRSVSLYFISAVITFLVMAGQLIAYYTGNAESISLFADTFHAGSDGVTLVGTTYLLSRTLRLFGSEVRTHRVFTFLNIALLFIGVFLAIHELYQHRGSPVVPSWNVLIVATIGGVGDWFVKKLLNHVNIMELPKTLRTNHNANLLHIKQDFWTSIMVVVSGIAIRFGNSDVDIVLGSLITGIIFWEGVGLLYEECSGKHFPFHLHHHTDEHCDHHH